MTKPIDIPWGPNQSYPRREGSSSEEEDQPLIQIQDDAEDEKVEVEEPLVQENDRRQGDEIVEDEESNDHVHVQVTLEDVSEESSDESGESSREGCCCLCRKVGKLVRATVPFFATSFLLYLRSIVSLCFLSRLGKVELAGGALALAVANLSGFSIITGFSTAMDPIVAQAFGADRWALINRAYLKTVCLVTSVSILISSLWVNAEPILLHLSHDAEIVKVAKAYLVYMIPELFGQAHLSPLRCLMRCQERTTTLAIASAASLLVDGAACHLLINRLEMGVIGVAVALGVSTLLLNIILALLLIVSDSAPHPWSSGTFQFFWQGWREFFALAASTAAAVCLEWWAYELILFASGFLHNPQTSIAATGILIQTSGILYIFPHSLSTMLSTTVGAAVGANRPSKAKLTTILGVLVAFLYGIAALLITVVLSSVWGKIFTSEAEILDMVSSALPLLGICELGNSLQTVVSGALAGTARLKTVAGIYLCSFYLIGAATACLLIFIFKLGFRGLWLGLALAQGSAAVMMMCVLALTDWQEQAKEARERISRLAAQGGEGLEESLLTSSQVL